MGYRSDVTITMYKQDFETLVRQASEDTNGALDLIKYATLYNNEASNIVTLYWDCIKWYDGCDEDVNFIMSFIRSNIQYHFIRIDEEAGDVEEENNDEHWMLCESTYIERYINVECAGNEVDVESSVNKILQDEIIMTNEANENIEEVSEAELFDVISA